MAALDVDSLKVHGYGQYYQLNLFSNFTFFLDDPVNGDQIKQVDTNRAVAGLDLLHERRATLFGTPLIAAAWFQFRVDTPRVIIANTADRHLLDRTTGREHLRDVVLAARQVRPRAPCPGRGS